MKWVLYNLAFAVIFPFLLPGFLLRMLRRGGYKARMGDRFGLYPESVIDKFRLPNGKDKKSKRKAPIWLHAVSVGEVQVALQLMREWRRMEPDVWFCFSTTSSTGWKIAEGGVTERDVLIYNPLDFPNFVKSALKTVRPRALVLTESEIWPVFIRRAKKMGIPIFLINARVSDRSAPRYAKAKWLFKDVFGCFSRIFAQSQLDRQRLLASGAPDGIVEVTGSFKFDVAHRNEAKERELRNWIEDTAEARRHLSHRILLGASTWPGEDEAMLRIYKGLPDDVILVIAPRHFEKADAVEANIVKHGFYCIRRSRGKDQPKSCNGRGVFLADTTGELMGLYGIADAVFVGKSLCEHGSQNMIEPCMCGKPTAVGPNTENFRPVMSDLLERNAIVQVGDEKELCETIVHWFSTEGADEAKSLGERAANAVAERRGVVPRCIGSIRLAVGKSCASTDTESAHTKTTAAGVVALLVAIAALAFAIFHGTGDKTHNALTGGDEFRFKAIDTVSAYIPLLEKPDARRIYLADSAAEAYGEILERAGLMCFTNGATGRFDVVLSCDPSRRDWADLLSKVAENGAMAWALDVRKSTMGTFKAAFDSFPCTEARLWMPGERDWILTGRPRPRKVKLSAMLEVFENERSFDDLATAQCDTIPEFFASYAGDRATAAGAFAANDKNALVRPEYFITKEIPDIDWIVAGDTEADILAATAKEVRSMQVVRRNVIEGNMLATAGNTDDAIAKWATANLRNPHDTMLLERMHRLAVNASAFQKVGNVKAATKCYETMVCVRPTDTAAIMEYATCLRQLGQTELANEVMDRAKTLINKDKKEETYE